MFELDKLYNADCMAGMKEIPDKYAESRMIPLVGLYGIRTTAQTTLRIVNWRGLHSIRRFGGLNIVGAECYRRI